MTDEQSSSTNRQSVQTSQFSTDSINAVFQKKGKDLILMPIKNIIIINYILPGCSNIFRLAFVNILYRYMQYRLFGATDSIVVLQPLIDLCTIVYSQALMDASRETLFSFIQNRQKNAAKAFFACVLINYYVIGLLISIVLGIFCPHFVSLFTLNEYVGAYLQIQLCCSIFGRSSFVFYREIMIIEQRVFAAVCMDVIYSLLSILITCVCIFLIDSDSMAKPDYYKLFAVIELLSYFFASLYPIYSIIAHFSTPRKWDVKAILNQNPLKLRFSNFIPFRFKLIVQIFVQTLPYLLKHAAEPVLCSFIMHQYHSYKYLPVWSQYGIIGCQLTRIFSQAASSISSQSELQLRHLFSINVKMDNTIRIREVLVKGALIVFCFQFFVMLCLNLVYRKMVWWYFDINEQFALDQVVFKKWALLWCVLVPYHFSQPLVEMQFGYFQIFQVITQYVVICAQMAINNIRRKRTEFNNIQVQLMMMKAIFGLCVYTLLIRKYTKQLKMKKIDPEAIETPITIK
ncbi:Conserved_hypothetical protein [Hexamita inflata]|uniref:Gustatory receptor n=1 Tax=Hexamita inflata TaxID=28002 RepID=A0ABP1H989_9EUKA